MTDRRTHRRVRAADADKKNDSSNEPSKQQYQVAKYLRWHCPTKQTPMEGRGVVVYFTASKAVDTLLASKWATNKGGKEPLFDNRESVVRYLEDLLKRDCFHRAKKITVKRIGGREEASSGATGSSQLSETESSPRASPRAAQLDKKSRKGLPEAAQDESSQAARRKKKIKLEWHPVQRFVDGKEAYVWLYEPTSVSQIVYGSLIVLGAIGLCLFPLWPPIVRQGVYYLALTAASLIGFLFFLAAFRYVPWAIMWALTLGKLHFWLLPNLTQDVGFLESFMPVYDYEWQNKDKEKDGQIDATDKTSKDKMTKSKKSAANSTKDAAGAPDTETEDDEEAADDIATDDRTAETVATDDVDPERATLRGRSTSPTQERRSSPSPSPVSKTADDHAENKPTSDADNHDEQQLKAPSTSSSHVPSGSSQDSSSQEEFEIIERDDNNNKPNAAQ